jgi:hypothetical protein
VARGKALKSKDAKRQQGWSLEHLLEVDAVFSHVYSPF